MYGLLNWRRCISPCPQCDMYCFVEIREQLDPDYVQHYRHLNPTEQVVRGILGINTDVICNNLLRLFFFRINTPIPTHLYCRNCTL